jgi:hypothetical protein
MERSFQYTAAPAIPDFTHYHTPALIIQAMSTYGKAVEDWGRNLQFYLVQVEEACRLPADAVFRQDGTHGFSLDFRLPATPESQELIGAVIYRAQIEIQRIKNRESGVSTYFTNHSPRLQLGQHVVSKASAIRQHQPDHLYEDGLVSPFTPMTRRNPTQHANGDPGDFNFNMPARTQPVQADQHVLPSPLAMHQKQAEYAYDNSVDTTFTTQSQYDETQPHVASGSPAAHGKGRGRGSNTRGVSSDAGQIPKDKRLTRLQGTPGRGRITKATNATPRKRAVKKKPGADGTVGNAENGEGSGPPPKKRAAPRKKVKTEEPSTNIAAEGASPNVGLGVSRAIPTALVPESHSQHVTSLFEENLASQFV